MIAENKATEAENFKKEHPFGDPIHVIRFSIITALEFSAFTTKILMTFSDKKKHALNERSLTFISSHIGFAFAEVYKFDVNQIKELFVFLNDENRSANIFEIINIVKYV